MEPTRSALSLQNSFSHALCFIAVFIQLLALFYVTHTHYTETKKCVNHSIENVIHDNEGYKVYELHVVGSIFQVWRTTDSGFKMVHSGGGWLY